MARYQVPTSFTVEETEKIDKRVAELNLGSRYAYLRYVALKDLGLEYIDSTRPKTTKKSKRNNRRENNGIEQTDSRVDTESIINDLDE